MIRVTEVLDYYVPRHLAEWMMKSGPAKVKNIQSEALAIGSYVDKIIQQDIKEGQYEVESGVPPQVTNCIRAWENFKRDNPDYTKKVMSIQDELVEGLLIGHPDIVLENGIDDIKTSKAIRTSYWLQVSKYYCMKFGQPSADATIGVIRLDKDNPSGKYEFERLGADAIRYCNEEFNRRYMAMLYDERIREFIRQSKEEGV